MVASIQVGYLDRQLLLRSPNLLITGTIRLLSLRLGILRVTHLPSTYHAFVPADPLQAVFTADAMARLRGHCLQDDNSLHRMNVLCASGPYPSDPWMRRSVQYWRAEKAAWEVYLEAAFACGLFEGQEGKDLGARLTHPDHTQFRCAMDECATSWLMAGPLRLRVTPRPVGRGAKLLDLKAEAGTASFNVEVKSTDRQVALKTGVVFSGNGDESRSLSRCREEAAKQFPTCSANVLVIFPRFMLRVSDWRVMILRAFFGQDTINIPIDRQTGEQAGEPYLGFKPDGRMLKMWPPETKPRHTRVSAIIIVEEDLVEHWTPGGKLGVTMDHRVLVVHNPHAAIKLPREIWRDYPQFVHEGDAMIWTDGKSAA